MLNVLTRSRNMTIEEVSVLFDTGRKGDAEAAARHFEHGKVVATEDEEKDIAAEQIDNVSKEAHPKVSSRVE